MPFKITPKGLDILGVFLEEPSKPRYGLDIAEQLDMRSGTLYPLLGRLERAGLLSSELETADSPSLRQGQRRFYRLTGAGEVQARLAIEAQLARLQQALNSRSRVTNTLQPRGAFP